jgi:tetratricopeptide (TPR) repeat protein
MDSATVKLFVGWFFVCIAATVAGMLPVANVAHGAGAAVGLLVGWAAVGPRRSLAIAGTVLLTVACVAGAWVARPYVNLSGEPALELAILGDAALDEEDPNRAIEHYRRSLALEPDDARVHYNLGIALQRAERLEEALRSYERAFELAPDADRRSAVKELSRHLGYVALGEGRGPEAIRLFERAAALYPDDPAVQQELRDARTSVGAFGDAAD